MTQKMSQQLQSKISKKNDALVWFCCLCASRVLFLLFTRFARVVLVVLSTFCVGKKKTFDSFMAVPPAPLPQAKKKQ